MITEIRFTVFTDQKDPTITQIRFTVFTVLSHFLIWV